MTHTVEITGSVLFALAVCHTFAVKRFQHLALQYPQGSIGENAFHLLGEVEIVFGLWAAVFVGTLGILQGPAEAIHYVERLNFTEPAFVFVIMAVASTRPIVEIAAGLVTWMARVLPLPKAFGVYLTALILGPLMGSFITEPAAMTVTALILKNTFFDQNPSARFKYLTLAALLVNISIGGVLTHFAAPPVLMVASKWSWDTGFMLTTFGWKAALAVGANAILSAVLLRKDLSKFVLRGDGTAKKQARTPMWLTAIHVLFLASIVLTSHHPIFFLGLFLFFQGIVTITQEYQDDFKLRESLLVGFFLAGLVVLGDVQGWWLTPILTRLSAFPLFFGASVLTAVVDNAALTYLGSQVNALEDSLKVALVSGAVAGGGLTIIANAPNPAGFAILRSGFGEEGISPIAAFLAALLPTLIAMTCLWALPSAR